jgi:hypothetical protein
MIAFHKRSAILCEMPHNLDAKIFSGLLGIRFVLSPASSAGRACALFWKIAIAFSCHEQRIAEASPGDPKEAAVCRSVLVPLLG